MPGNAAAPRSGARGRKMKDVQGSPDYRKMPIQKVGIRNIRYPITVRDKSREKQDTVANVSLSVNLPHTNRGTHMSRFVEVLDRFKSEVSYHTLDLILIEIKKALQAEESHIELAFPFFLRKKAPISALESVMSYDCVIEATYNNHLDIATRVEVPVHTLCPCSKEIATVSAHNQRGTVAITVGMTKFIWIEDLVQIAEEFRYRFQRLRRGAEDPHEAVSRDQRGDHPGQASLPHRGDHAQEALGENRLHHADRGWRPVPEDRSSAVSIEVEEAGAVKIVQP